MNISAMRAIDRFVGIPLCWMTGAWRALFPGRTASATPKSFLVTKFFGMGSVLLTTPFLSSLRQAFPHATIIYLSFESNKDLIDLLPQPDVRLTISADSPTRFVRDTLAALSAIRRLSVDVVFDLEFFSKFSTLVSVLSGAHMRVGFALPTFWRRSNLTHPVELDRTAHVTHAFMRQIAVLGVEEPEEIKLSTLSATPAEHSSMERKLGLGTNGLEPVTVNINAGTTSLERRWMPDRFARVIHSMHEENPARRFFFIGTRQEFAYVREAVAGAPDISAYCTNCAGNLNFGELIALLERSSLLITNDSGPMHIAASVGTPVVGLFGPESPQFYGPIGTSSVVYKSIECSPCLNIYAAKAFVCPYDARCMREISVEEVLSVVNEAIAASTVRR